MPAVLSQIVKHFVTDNVASFYVLSLEKVVGVGAEVMGQNLQLSQGGTLVPSPCRGLVSVRLCSSDVGPLHSLCCLS